jgi:hypothetical protein
MWLDGAPQQNYCNAQEEGLYCLHVALAARLEFKTKETDP